MTRPGVSLRAALAGLALAFAAAATAGEFPLTPTPMSETAEGEELLAYLAGCALPAGEAAMLATPDGPVRLEGSLGLAPNWRRRGLAPAEARLVSACILARTNRFGVPVEISLRADPEMSDPPPALRADATERTEFPLHEGAFFGDLFALSAPARVCQGRAAIETPDRLRAARRVCALSSGATTPDGRPLSACGFVITGPCAGPGDKPLPEDAIHVYLTRPVVGAHVRASPRGTSGDVYYLEPGHVPIYEEITEVLEFSPKEPHQQTIDVVNRTWRRRQIDDALTGSILLRGHRSRIRNEDRSI